MQIRTLLVKLHLRYFIEQCPEHRLKIILNEYSSTGLKSIVPPMAVIVDKYY